MRLSYTNLETCHEATGVVIVVDVIRAFTNAAFAFSRGAKEIYPVSTVEEALQFKAENPNSLACGEVGGLPPTGFDFGNSPTQTNKLNLTEKIIVQRTGAGTQGIVRSVKADLILATSFVVANATARYIQMLPVVEIAFVITGQTDDERGDEDLACAEYLEALLKGQQPNTAPFIERVFKSHDARMHLDPNLPEFPISDLDLCTQINVFDFTMLVTKLNGRHVMRALKT